MKRMRSSGLILIMAGLLFTSGPTWAAGGSTNLSPLQPGISTGALSGVLDVFGGLWDSVLSGIEALWGEKTDVAESGSDPGTVDPEPQDGPGPLYPGGGCIDPNGTPVNVFPCPY